MVAPASGSARERSLWLALVGVAVLALPGILLRMDGADQFGVLGGTALRGLSIVAAAFLIAWTSEAAEVDIPQGVAVALVALIAVLPEYAVSMAFAWAAGRNPEFVHYAVANMTGGNRLLIGGAWPAVFFLYWFRTRERVLRLEHGHAIEVIALAAAAVYSFLLAFRRDITLYDAVVLGGIFFVYVYLVSRVPSEEPELVGPSRVIGRLPTIQRRVLIVTLFVYSAAAILTCAEPFADGLVHSGKQLGIDEFLLVQWIAPLASEAPEFLFASILAWRGRAAVGMGVVLSSAVNQWTLLVGGLPVVYALSRGDLTPLPLDARQTTEVLLTAAQCTFAVAVMLSLSMSRFEAGMLLGLFTLQFVLPFESARHAMAGLYLVLTVIIGLRNWRDVGGLLTLARHQQVEPSGSP